MNFDDGPGNGQPVRSNTAPRETTVKKSASFTNLAPGFFARGTGAFHLRLKFCVGRSIV